MFKELAPYLRQRAVLLTVTHIEDDQIRVNVIPQKLKDGENLALTTPLTVTGTADELDRDLPTTLVGFVSAHLQLGTPWTGRKPRWTSPRRLHRQRPAPRARHQLPRSRRSPNRQKLPRASDLFRRHPRNLHELLASSTHLSRRLARVWKRKRTFLPMIIVNSARTKRTRMKLRNRIDLPNGAQ